MPPAEETTPLLREENPPTRDDGVEEATRSTPPIVVFLALYFGVFIAALDGTIVTALLSHIASELNELPRIQWIATGYLVSSAAFQPLYGKISDIFGRKCVLIFCNLMFGLGCLMCGLSQTLGQLVAGRVVSGIGGGGMLSLSTIAISDLVPLRQRGIFQGFGNIAFGLGAGVGGVFGGLVSASLGWRTAFNLQVPAILLSNLLVAWFAPETSPGLTFASSPSSSPPKLMQQLKRLDVFGSITLVVSLVFLMLGITEGGRSYPWTHPLILLCLCTAVVFAALFILVEIYVAKEPTLPMMLFKHRTIVASSLTNLFMTMSVYAVLFYAPLTLTALYGYTPLQVGQRLVANFLGVSIGSVGAGIYMRKTGKYFWLGVLSPILYFIGVAVLVFKTSWFSEPMVQYLCLFCAGSGYAAMLTVTLLALIAAVPHEYQAVTTSIQYTFRGIGSTLGVSVASSIFQNTLRINLFETEIPSKVIDRVLSSVEAIRQVPVEYQPTIIGCYEVACVAVFTFSFVLAVVSTISSAMMREHVLHSTIEREE